jgi:cytochrome c-type biogenesis protein CcmE
MHPVRKQRLIMVLFIVIFSSIAIGLIVYALRENLNLFYPPSKIVSGEVPHNVRIRGGGCVKPGSVKRSDQNLDVSFVITDGAADVTVKFSGILPDLFAEGEAAVINGKINDRGEFEASEVLAKHDENYLPPEVAEGMKQAGGEHQESCEKLNYAL